MTRRSPGEGSIRRRTDGRWEAFLSLGTEDGRRHRVSFVHRDQREVELRLEEARRAAARDRLSEEQQETVAEFLEQWLERARRKVRAHTFHRYEGIVRRHLVPAIGDEPLRGLSPHQVETMLGRQLDSGLSALTVRHHRGVLRTALNVAMRWSLVERNAASLAEPPALNRREVMPVGPVEARRILIAIRGHRLEALFAITLTLGLRQSEILGLRWADIDDHRRALAVKRSLHRIGPTYVFMEPKTKRSARSIDIPDPIWALLQGQRDRQCSEQQRASERWTGAEWGDLIFTTPTGDPIQGRVVTRMLQGILHSAGLPPMRFHDLRHAAATLMLALGIPLLEVSRALGHSQTSTTLDIYSHALPEMRSDARDRLTAALAITDDATEPVVAG